MLAKKITLRSVQVGGELVDIPVFASNLIEAKPLRKTSPFSQKKHHTYMAKYHAGEVKHHGEKIAYFTARVKEFPKNTVANEDYKKSIVKHEAFKNYHEKQGNLHSRKCKNCD